jgi:uncharacterized membrane-anchored protein
MTTDDTLRPAAAPSTERPVSRVMLTKVPEATVLFWITKILTTGMGETTSDYFGRTSDPVVVVGLAGLVLVGSLVLQLRVSRYVPVVYWLAVVMVSVFGTMAADVWHVGLGVSYLTSTTSLGLLLLAILAAWYRSERTLSIHTITTRRREYFYWATVLCTFALGTASGDMLASTMHLGYLVPGILFTVLIALPALAHWKLGLNGVFAFWTAYIITRPLGASFSDWAAVLPAHGGLGFGPGPVSLVLGGLILVALAFARPRAEVKGDLVPVG